MNGTSPATRTWRRQENPIEESHPLTARSSVVRQWRFVYGDDDVDSQGRAEEGVVRCSDDRALAAGFSSARIEKANPKLWGRDCRMIELVFLQCVWDLRLESRLVFDVSVELCELLRHAEGRVAQPSLWPWGGQRVDAGDSCLLFCVEGCHVAEVAEVAARDPKSGAP